MKGMLLKMVLFLVAAVAFILCSLYCVPDRELMRKALSPDGAYEVRLYRSLSDFTHAPYGYELALRRSGRFLWDESYIFYAGYCDAVPEFGWQGNTAIQVSCPSGSKTRTRADQTWDISISYSLNRQQHGNGGAY